MSLQNCQSECLELLFSDELQTDLYTSPNYIGLSIYRRNMQTRLTQTLAHIYPMIVKLTGEDFFRQMAHAYVLHYPSRSGNLNDYGEYFPDFLKKYPGLTQLDYLSEVAHFEWHCHVLQFASDHPALDLTRLETLSPVDYDNLHFMLHPASSLMKFSFPLLRVVDLCSAEDLNDIHLDEQEELLLVLRRDPPDHDIVLITLSPAEFHCLSALHTGSSLSRALESTLKSWPDFTLAEYFPHWIQKKILVEFLLMQNVDKTEKCK